MLGLFLFWLFSRFRRPADVHGCLPSLSPAPRRCRRARREEACPSSVPLRVVFFCCFCFCFFFLLLFLYFLCWPRSRPTFALDFIEQGLLLARERKPLQ